MMEQWKAIPNFPGYEVSNYGSVRSFWQRGQRLWRLANVPQRILRPATRGKSYLRVTLWKEGKRFPILVHRLVLLAFVGPCPTGQQACHNDGKWFNNFLGNLRWDTSINNHADQRKHGTDNAGERNGRAKLTESQVIQIRELDSQGCSFQKIEELFPISLRSVYYITRHKTWKHMSCS